MTTKQLEAAFNKTIHSDLKDIITFKIEKWDGETGIIVFMEDFENIFKCSKKMFQTMCWYYSNPKKFYDKIKDSTSGYDRGLAVIDSRTGTRTLDNFKDDNDEFVLTMLEIRKKYKR